MFVFLMCNQCNSDVQLLVLQNFSFVMSKFFNYGTVILKILKLTKNKKFIITSPSKYVKLLNIAMMSLLYQLTKLNILYIHLNDLMV